eukprot:scaffold31771_cov129-Isochrysis_galbana.AAC.7
MTRFKVSADDENKTFKCTLAAPARSLAKPDVGAGCGHARGGQAEQHQGSRVGWRAESGVALPPTIATQSECTDDRLGVQAMQRKP